MDGQLRNRWVTLQQKKSNIFRRCEDYARWTLPHVFPETGVRETELSGPTDSTGARCANNMANKLMMTLFPPYQPFFRASVSDDVIKELDLRAQNGDEDAKAILDGIDERLAEAERGAMRLLDYNLFRTEATNATKGLIITGNALMYHPEKGRCQTYSIRDYCVVRDAAGTVIELMTQDTKAFGTFPESVQKKIANSNRQKKYMTETPVTIYTSVKLSDGLYRLRQAADMAELDAKGQWNPDDLPYIALTWNRVRGEDYGRGLVEDYAGAFHAVTVLTNTVVSLAGIASDIKFFVNPASQIDVAEVNKSESGTYHSGNGEDITTSNLNKLQDFAFIQQQLDSFRQQLAQAFLLNSSVTRQAERVTAEEIRYVAQELEISHGGVYSRFAEEWQLKLATLLMRRLRMQVGSGSTMVYPQIITGLDSLSRAGDLDNLHLFIMDLQKLEAVPEDIRRDIDPIRFMNYVGVRRGIDPEKFTLTEAQKQAQQEKEQAAMQQAYAMQATADIATQAGKQAVTQ